MDFGIIVMYRDNSGKFTKNNEFGEGWYWNKPGRYIIQKHGGSDKIDIPGGQEPMRIDIKSLCDDAGNCVTNKKLNCCVTQNNLASAPIYRCNYNY